MEENKNPATQEETPSMRIEDQPAQSLWQQTKESWYDKVNLTVKQLDTIITVCWILIFVVIAVIALDALDIFNPFGY